MKEIFTDELTSLCDVLERIDMEESRVLQIDLIRRESMKDAAFLAAELADFQKRLKKLIDVSREAHRQ